MKIKFYFPFDQKPAVVNVAGNPGQKTLREIVHHECDVSLAIVNGLEIQEPASFVPSSKDFVEIYVEPKGSLAVAGLVSAGVLASATTVTAVVVAAAVNVILAVGLSFAIQALSPKPRLGGGSLGGNSGRREEAFGITGLTNTVVEGTPAFVVYGQRRVFGHLIGTNTLVSDDGKNMSFSALYFMGETGGDGYESITDVEINGSPSVDLPGTTINTRLGLPAQSVISGFEEITQAYSDNRPLAFNTGIIYTLRSTTASSCRLIVSYPGGLRALNKKNGQELPGLSKIRVEFKRKVDVVWILGAEHTVSHYSNARFFRDFPLDFGSSDEWEIRVTEFQDKNATIPATISADAQLFNVVEIEQSVRTYPNAALLSIHGAGSEQVQSIQGMEVSALVKGKKVKVWNGATFTTEWTRKRAWILRDILTHSLVGLGHRIKESFFDDDLALVGQNYWDESVTGFNGTEPRDLCDVLINDRRPGWDWIRDIAADGLAIIVMAAKVKLIIQRPGLPSMLWASPGNIIKGSLKRHIGGPNASINTVRAEFPSEDINYKNEVVEIVDSNIGSNPTSDESYTFLSITRKSQAIRIARIYLKLAVLVVRRWTWKAGRTAQVSLPLDIANLSYRTFKNKRGWSGRVKHVGTSTELFLDDLVVLESGKTYEAKVMNAKGETQSRTITNGPGSYGKVIVSSAFNPLLVEGDLWAIGEAGVQIETVMVESVTGASDGEYTINVAEYQSDVFNEEALPSIENRRFFRKSFVPPLPLIDASVKELPQLLADGSYSSKIRFDITPGMPKWAATVQLSTINTVDLDGALPGIDDYFNGAKFTLGAQSKTVTDYDGKLRRATLDSNLSSVPTALGETILSNVGFSIKSFNSEDAPDLAVNAIDGSTSTHWKTQILEPQKVVGRIGAVLTGFRTGPGSVSFTVPGGTQALLICFDGGIPTNVQWDFGGTPQDCIKVNPGVHSGAPFVYFSVFKLLFPTTGFRSLNFDSPSGIAWGISIWCFNDQIDLTRFPELIEYQRNTVNTSETRQVAVTPGEFLVVAFGASVGVNATPEGVTVEQYDANFTGAGGEYAATVTGNVTVGFSSLGTQQKSVAFLRIYPIPGIPAAEPPHLLEIDTGLDQKLVKMDVYATVTPRIEAVLVSIAPDNGGQPGQYLEVFSGIWEDASPVTIRFPATVGRFVKIEPLSNWNGDGQAIISNVNFYVEGTTPNPDTVELEFEKYDIANGFVIEVANDPDISFAFLAQAIGTSYELQSSLGDLQFFRFTPVSISGAKRLVSRFIRPIVLIGDVSAPTAPTGVKATGFDQAIFLEFIPPTAEDLSVIEIYRSDFSQVSTARFIAEIPGDNTSYSDGQLEAPKTYYYWLKARDTSGNQSEFSSQTAVSATTTTAVGDSDPPATPTGLNLTPSGEVLHDGGFLAQLQVAWDANSETDLFGYHVEFKKTVDSTYVLFFAKTNNTTLLSLLPNVSYDVRVRAVDLTNNVSPYSSVVTASTTSNPGAPAAPIGVAAIGFPLAIGVSWSFNAERDIAFYEVDRADNASFTINVILVQKALINSFIDRLPGGVTRYYRVRAVRRTNVSSVNSSIVSASTSFVDTAEIDALAIDASKLADGSVTGNKILDAAITSLKIAAESINNSHLQEFIIEAANLAANSVTQTKILDNSISTSKISANAITSGLIASGAIIAGKIAAGVVTATELAAGSVIANKLAANIIASTHLRTDVAVITVAAQIQNALIGNAHITNLAVTSAKIGDLEVGTIKISNNAVSSNAEVVVGVYSQVQQLGVWKDTGITIVFASSGGRIQILAHMHMVDATTANAAFQFRLLRNGVQIRSTPFINYPGSSAGQTVIISDLDVPAAGTYTYKIQATTSSGIESFTYLKYKHYDDSGGIAIMKKFIYQYDDTTKDVEMAFFFDAGTIPTQTPPTGKSNHEVALLDAHSAETREVLVEAKEGNDLHKIISGEIKREEKILPDAIIAHAGFESTPTIVNFQGHEGAEPANNDTDTSIHVSMPTPAKALVEGAGYQTLEVIVGLYAVGQTGTPTVRLEVWENGAGSAIATSSEIDVTDFDFSQVVTLTWNAADLTTADGSAVEVKVFGTKSGGAAAVKQSVNIGKITWKALRDTVI